MTTVQTEPAKPPTRQPFSLPIPALNTHSIASVLETAGFIVASIMLALNNGSDTHNGIVAAVVAAVMHAYNH